MTEKPSILIVDDELYILDSMRMAFLDAGFTVETAESGEEALAWCRKRRFDACIVDIRLSGMDGVDAIREIREMDPRTRVLVFTGSLEFEITDDLRQLGLSEDRVVYKPIYDLDILVEKIRDLGARPSD